MEQLNRLLSICKASVTISSNRHKDYYQSVSQYIKEQSILDEGLIDEIGTELYEEMQKRNTIIEVHAYPNTPIGSYKVYHYDIDKAIETMLRLIEN